MTPTPDETPELGSRNRCLLLFKVDAPVQWLSTLQRVLLDVMTPVFKGTFDRESRNTRAKARSEGFGHCTAAIEILPLGLDNC